ncbi:MAG: NAD(P)H-hydrate epimerase [Renibacterium salmoninarum]|nr:NAD(P)H-hydrate epimerase [Renibacterium salmoninarum]
MLSAYTGTAVRAAEKSLLDAGLGEALMARAAHGLSNAVLYRLDQVYGSTVLVLAGSGNNGGDALYAGALLARRGAAVTAVLTAERWHGPALAALRAAGGRALRLAEEPTEALATAQSAVVVMDGILGTGARGGLRGAAADLVEQLQEHPGVVACDLPSGLDPDTGEISGPVLTAAETVTFGGIKAGLLLPPGESYVGEISLIDLDLDLPRPDLQRLDQRDLAELWPRPGSTDHKYSRGVLGVVAGSAQYPGAAQLSVGGALAAGVGMVRYLGLAQMPPEVVAGAPSIAANRVQAWLVGPGVADDPVQEQRCYEAMTSRLPVVGDAGALALLPQGCGPNTVLTPHAGELAGLLSRGGQRTERADVEREPLRYARVAVELTGATVLLKGSTTVVVAPSGAVYSQSEGTPWLATAGSGDTLAGILGALLASGVEPAIAAAMAASVHGRAGVLASNGGPITASDIARAVPRVIADLLS